MREAERVTRGAGGRDGLRRAARTVGRQAGRVLAEPKGYADRIRSRAEQRDRAVDAPLIATTTRPGAGTARKT